MKAKQISFFMTVAVLFASIAIAPKVDASADNSALVVFTTWVEVPGGILPGGRYIFKEVDTKSGHVTQIYDQVSGIYIASVGSRQIERADKAAEPVHLMETARYKPDAVQAWFRPGSRKGEELIYPNGDMTATALLAPPQVGR